MRSQYAICSICSQPYAFSTQCILNFQNRTKNLATAPFLKRKKNEFLVPHFRNFDPIRFFIFLERSRHGGSNAAYRIKIGPVVFEIDRAKSAPPHYTMRFSHVRFIRVVGFCVI